MTAAITTVIPTYRRPLLLKRALRSVLRQTFPNFIVCVYDNASGDETEAAVTQAAAGDARVRYVRHAENIGGTRNFLFGMEHVETPYFSFLSDDDVLLPNFYETALAGFEQSPSAYMSVTSTIEVSAEGELRYAPLAAWPHEGVYEPPDGAFQMLDNRHPTWTTILFRREAIDAVGTIDLDIGAPSDLEYELRLASRFPVVVSFEACGAYVSHAASGSLRETATVAAGYEKMRRKFESDANIAPAVRHRLSGRLARQLRMKLIEVWVKSLVRGDDTFAREAAEAMRAQYGPAALGSLLALGARLCAKVEFARGALRSIESARLSHRTRKSGGPSVTTALPAIREALAL